LLPDLLLDLCRSIAIMDSSIPNGAKDGCPLGYKVSTFLSMVSKLKFNIPARVSFLISTMLPVRNFSIRRFRCLRLFPCGLSPLCSKELIERLTFCSLAATVVETIRSNAWYTFIVDFFILSKNIRLDKSFLSVFIRFVTKI